MDVPLALSKPVSAFIEWGGLLIRAPLPGCHEDLCCVRALVSQKGILDECVSEQMAKCIVPTGEDRQLSLGYRGFQSIYSEREAPVESVVSSPRLCFPHCGHSLT